MEHRSATGFAPSASLSYASVNIHDNEAQDGDLFGAGVGVSQSISGVWNIGAAASVERFDAAQPHESYNAATLTLTRSAVRDNSTLIDAGSANNNGGGICSDGATFLIDSEVTDNDADDAGGGVWHESGNLVVYRSSISGNTAGTDGGGVWIASGCDIQY